MVGFELRVLVAAVLFGQYWIVGLDRGGEGIYFYVCHQEEKGRYEMRDVRFRFLSTLYQMHEFLTFKGMFLFLACFFTYCLLF